jgi:hypothetical protein
MKNYLAPLLFVSLSQWGCAFLGGAGDREFSDRSSLRN